MCSFSKISEWLHGAWRNYRAERYLWWSALSNITNQSKNASYSTSIQQMPANHSLFYLSHIHIHMKRLVLRNQCIVPMQETCHRLIYQPIATAYLTWQKFPVCFLYMCLLYMHFGELFSYWSMVLAWTLLTLFEILCVFVSVIFYTDEVNDAWFRHLKGNHKHSSIRKPLSVSRKSRHVCQVPTILNCNQFHQSSHSDITE